MADKKCPYCYHFIETIDSWKKDPILLPNGSRYKWKSGTSPEETELEEVTDIEQREYKGLYQIAQEAKEIQDKLKELEEKNLPEEERTKFSPLESENAEYKGIFQVLGKHIKEMRESVEKLLESFGLEKTDYFNYDEEGNHIIHPKGDKLEWTDNVINDKDWDKFQVKAIHIEDLRHYITIFFKENWEDAEVKTYTNLQIISGNNLWQPYYQMTPESLVEITEIKDLHIKQYSFVFGNGLFNAATVFTSTVPILDTFRLIRNAALFFDINSIIIPSKTRIVAGNTVSYDCFSLRMTFRSFFNPSVIAFIITYYFNYNEYFIITTPIYSLKGEVNIGTNQIDLWNDCLEEFPVLLDYYNGVINDRGFYLDLFVIGISCSMTDISLYEVNVDNLKIH